MYPNTNLVQPPVVDQGAGDDLDLGSLTFDSAWRRARFMQLQPVCVAASPVSESLVSPRTTASTSLIAEARHRVSRLRHVHAVGCHRWCWQCACRCHHGQDRRHRPEPGSYHDEGVERQVDQDPTSSRRGPLFTTVRETRRTGWAALPRRLTRPLLGMLGSLAALAAPAGGLGEPRWPGYRWRRTSPP